MQNILDKEVMQECYLKNLTSVSLKQKIYQTLKTKDSLVINMSAQAFQTGNKILLNN